MNTAHWRLSTNDVGMCQPPAVTDIEKSRETSGTADDSNSGDEVLPTSRPLHRVREAREQQGVSLRSASRHLDISIEEVRAQEHEMSNLSLATLYRWQQLLDVPIANLLVDVDGPLSEPVLKRARMLKLMKTAGAIVQQTHSTQVMRLANMLVDQLVEIMPELKGVSPWHVVGQRRTMDEYGRAAERTLPDNLFVDPGC